MPKEDKKGRENATDVSQYEKFKAAAKEHGAEDIDGKKFDKSLKKLASMPSEGRKKKLSK